MARKHWNVCKLNKDLASKIAQRYSLAPFSALLLIQRGLDTPEKLDAFFDDSGRLEDPFHLPDMQKAVDRINQAIFDGERICIYGDYDCDGVTSTALLYTYLETQGADVTYMLPNRLTDGYGLNMNVVDRMKELGTQLVVTVDNGIAAIDEADKIYALGMELVITDHHLEGDRLPRAEAIVDPHRKDKNAPYQDYCGAGIALQLCCAMEGSSERVIEDLGDLAAIGTVADLVPLTGENRKIVQMGLRLINNEPRPGVQAIIEKSGLSGKAITSMEISFGIGPRINASGRMDTAEHALDLLLAEDPEEADALAEEINQLNQKRHSEEDKIFSEALQYLESHPREAHAPVLVVAGEGWHEGVLGIVASKILEKYLRPVIVLSIKDGKAKGSARSISGFSIYDAIKSCEELLLTFGGHELAAGLSLDPRNIDEFRNQINQYAYGRERVYPQMDIDVRLNPDAVSLKLLSSLEVLEPFGMANQSPVFGLFKMKLDDVSIIGEKGDHRRLTMHRDGQNTRIQAVCFRVPNFPYQAGDVVDTIVTLHRNYFRGVESVSVFIEDIRPTGTDDDAMVRDEILFDRVMSGQPLSAEELKKIRPNRKVFAKLYQYIQRTKSVSIQNYEYLNRITGVNSLIQTRIALEAMRELGLLTIDSGGIIHLPKMEQKVNLLTAPIMQTLERG